ncbi:MAG: peptide chain release factor N(5)-glutamine methyltransferase [Candidatus Borkfalkiaceae bacterium]|nr:peptide chain release factor N(5)-glutamine methyltransferase [Christensenellaceae bacterium]
MSKSKREKRVSIGGQAVLEGVMMRGAKSMAIAVRDADGVIRLETKRVKPLKTRKIPVIRGIVSFFQSLFSGTAVLMRSADVYGEGEPSKFEKWLAEKLKVNVMSVVGTLSMILGLALAVLLFIFVPQQLRIWIVGNDANPWAKNFIEGGFKLLIFIGYILLCSLLKDIKRTFMYHGAEHKTISCFEKGLPLTPENAKQCTRVHNRCGTTFLVFVMVISILAFACLESLLATFNVTLGNFVRVLIKIAVLPLVAGLSYELLKFLAKTESKVFYPIKAPGLLLQRLTTKEPTEDMLEVAITAFNAVLEMDADESIPERRFVTAEKRSALTERAYETLKNSGVEEKAEAEWIVALTLGVKRSEVYTDDTVKPSLVEKVDALVKERATGRPLWYCVGNADFYGYTLKTDERALIPRPETELLAENALKYLDGGKSALDLCTGSGAIAIVLKKKSGAEVTATDVSGDALALAAENAAKNGAEIEFIKSDMFAELGDRKFDLIVSNPPYVASDEIETLQREVRDFEPRIALDGGRDGLDYYRIIAKEAKSHLKDGGILLLECGENQADAVIELLYGYKNAEKIKDLENIDRIVKAEA